MRRSAKSTMLASSLALGLALSSSAGMAREPANWDDIRQELRVVEDVIAAAVRSELGRGSSVTKAEAQYLANQGVLINLTVREPWIRIEQNGSGHQIDLDVPLHDVPRMVHEILGNLDIQISPFDAEGLAELSELRAEQRELRGEQRELRAQLRKKRREYVRERDDGDREDIAEDIAEIETELKGLDTVFDALQADIDAQYQQIEEDRDRARHVSSDDKRTDIAIEQVVAGAVCEYGNTLKSLREEDHVTVAVNDKSGVHYLTFEMGEIERCEDQDISVQELLDGAWSYTTVR